MQSPILPLGAVPWCCAGKFREYIPQQDARWETCPQRATEMHHAALLHLTSWTTWMAASHQGKRAHYINERCIYKFPCYKDGMARVPARSCILGTFDAGQESVPRGWFFSGLLLPWIFILFSYLWKIQATGGAFYLPVNVFIQWAPLNSQWRRVGTLERN